MIPTTADDRSACPRGGHGRGDRDGRLTVADSGRLPGGKMRRAFSEFRGRRTRDLSGVLWVVVGMATYWKSTPQRGHRLPSLKQTGWQCRPGVWVRGEVTSRQAHTPGRIAAGASFRAWRGEPDICGAESFRRSLFEGGGRSVVRLRHVVAGQESDGRQPENGRACWESWRSTSRRLCRTLGHVQPSESRRKRYVFGGRWSVVRIMRGIHPDPSGGPVRR